jgi:hypothetical protein
MTMKASTLVHSMRMTALTFAAVFSVFALTARAFADDLPSFSDPDVNAFIKTYAQFVDDYVTALKAAKTGDNSKLADVQTKAGALQTQATQAAGKLKPDESDKFQKFVAACSQKIVEATK